MGPDPSVAQVRLAVRKALTTLIGPAGGLTRPLVLVACSGGPDSLALAAATARRGAPVTGVAGSPWTTGCSPARTRRPPGSRTRWPAWAWTRCGRKRSPRTARRPGAAARAARYAALDGAADRLGAVAVLLGHTLDDQAETVLLRLARGSGARSLAGMAPVSGRYLRPLLGVRRAVTAAACAAEGLSAWADPHNTDPAYTRVRVRRQALPARPRRSVPASPRRWPAPRTCCVPTPRCSTRWPPPNWPGWDSGGGLTSLGWPRCRRRSGPGCCTRPRRRRAARAARCPPGTWPAWPGWSPAGTGSAGRTCPGDPGARRYGKLLFTARHSRGAGRRHSERGGRGWTRLTSAATWTRC